MTGEKSRASLILFFLCLLGTLAIYGELIFLDPLLGFDDRALISNLMPFKKWIDIQPVRDLSYLLDIWVGQWTSLKSFHFSNVVIWMAAGVVLWRIFNFVNEELKVDKLIIGLLWLLFMFNPVFVYSVAWVAARKHLLSFFFTLMATYTFLKGFGEGDKVKKSQLKALVYYLLGALSQPINALWPIWALLVSRNKGVKDKKNAVTYLFTMLFILGINLYYYTFVFEGHSKFVMQGTEIILFPLFAYGRYLINFLVPVNLAISYEFYSALNLIGASLCVVILLWLLKKWKKFENLNWPTYFILLLAPVAINRTDYFISNPYLLNASLALPIIFLIAIKSFKHAYPLIKGLLGVSVLAFIVISFFEAKAWRTSASLYEKSYEREKSYRNIRMHLVSLFSQEIKDIKKIDKVLEDLVINTEGADPSLINYLSRFSRLYFNEEALPLEVKLRRFKEMADYNPFSYFYLSKILAMKGECQKSQVSLKSFKEIPKALDLIEQEKLKEIEKLCPY